MSVQDTVLKSANAALTAVLKLMALLISHVTLLHVLTVCLSSLVIWM